MSQLGFKKTLVLAMLAIITLAVGVSSLINFKSYYLDFKDSIYDSTQFMVAAEKREITKYLENKAATVKQVAEEYAQYGHSDNHAERMRLAAVAGDIPNLTIGFENGDAFCSADVPGWIDHKNPPSYDPRKRPWYQSAMASNGLVYTEPYEDATTQELMVSIGMKVDRVGVVLADIPLTVLSNAVKKFSNTSHISVIVDEQGNVLASSSKYVKNGQNIDSEPSLRQVSSQLGNRNASVVDYSIDGSDKVMFIDEIGFGDKHWYLMVGMDKGKVFEKLNATKRNSIIITLICSVLSIVVTMLILNLLYRPIIALKETVLNLSSGDGDLTQRLIVKTDDDIGTIAKGINEFIEQLQNLMLQVKEVAKELESNATELKMSSTDNSQVLGQHAQETDMIVTAIEEMSATANTVAQNASESSAQTQDAASIGEASIKILNEAKSNVSQLVLNVEKTSSQMSHLTKETESISGILNVIGDIADQTNLLALNAAIEAARAGEQGRGFAVVADEVRALAKRTQESTVEVENALSRLLAGNNDVLGLMESTRNESKKSLESTESVNATLNELVSQIMSVRDLSFQIATAAEEQSSVTGEVNQNMVAIQEIVYALTQNGEKVVGQSDQITEMNQKLTSIVGRFKLN
ncbi:methyl-accepting chemotaxis protein [Vibrio parahaemolyticus]|uniref:Chemotaxis protein n=1 Tax=Vibrio parahaemolyticus TaxID=670 RepID=A0A1B1LR69_VIBPH|nr:MULTISPECIES: methyl-accepting chemotaxis protein [Vibrio]ANS55531.1 chemotaxis protein [Vibrio parahaemolyticus]MBJ6954076.1 methyl-accepting chemotaxis protein [Vibrio cholerae]MCI9701259.1 methyl-accepting chemotaxis protein [Vibrio parahaemolyticus]MCR9815687.1 methyl-accepting chemotaxis protein [Vibrio parahaemolyticus]MDF4315806.1 methyl-accepting chemotaxis protein [Vibrio parahaemolyticus]